jgi:nitrite reductase/ring-hydroxylating ferredoxin subunit
MAMTKLIECDLCPAGKGVFIEQGGRELAVFRLDDPVRFVVMDNTCPHAGGNLAGGEVCGTVVACPWHHWQFDLESGICVHSPLARVRMYRSEVRDGVLYAELGE